MSDGVADPGSRPIRLLLSGGGHRAMLGSVGVMLALMATGDWGRVREIVSVSGGSPTNAALLSLPANGHTGEVADAVRLGEFYRRLVDDAAAPWATPRRLLIVAGMLGSTAAVVVAVLATGGLLPGTGGSRPWVAVSVAAIAFPVVLQFGRAGAGRYVRDTMDATTAGRGVLWADLHDPSMLRQHVVCATGLSSGAPYYFWAGRARLLPIDSQPVEHDGRGDLPVKERWGIDVHPDRYRAHTVSDVVFASSSLPLVGGVSSPRLDRADRQDGVTARPEPLVDGGGSGVFGAQVADSGRLRVETTRSSLAGPPITILAVDAFRHESSTPGLVGRVLDAVRTRVSSLWFLIDYIKVTAEALYVNDLADTDGVTLIRLCTGDLTPVHAEPVPTVGWKAAFAEVVERRQKAHDIAEPNVVGVSVDDRLAVLRTRSSKIGLFFLNDDKAITAVTTGVVATYLARTPRYDEFELEQVLKKSGALLFGDDSRRAAALSSRWSESLNEAIEAAAKAEAKRSSDGRG